MTDRIQELMEELGPGTRLIREFEAEGRWLAQVGVGVSLRGQYADTPIEALTKLRDKVKPRTPEQVVEEVFPRQWRESIRVGFADAVIYALRDAGMLGEGE